MNFTDPITNTPITIHLAHLGRDCQVLYDNEDISAQIHTLTITASVNNVDGPLTHIELQGYKRGDGLLDGQIIRIAGHHPANATIFGELIPKSITIEEPIPQKELTE